MKWNAEIVGRHPRGGEEELAGELAVRARAFAQDAITRSAGEPFRRRLERDPVHASVEEDLTL